MVPATGDLGVTVGSWDMASNVASIGIIFSIDEYDEDMPFYKIRLLNYNNFDLNHAANIIFDQKCTDMGIKIVHRTKYTPDMTIYRVCIDSMKSILPDCLYPKEPY